MPAMPVMPVMPVMPALPDLHVPDDDPPTGPINAHEAGREVARLDILHALERGELSVEAAMQRLAEIEEA
jgi:hypothetical protein